MEVNYGICRKYRIVAKIDLSKSSDFYQSNFLFPDWKLVFVSFDE